MKNKPKHYFLLLLSAVLLELSFAPFNQVYTAFFALIPLFWVLDQSRNKFLTGFVWGLFYSIFSIHWLAFNSGTYWWLASVSMMLASAFLALNYGLIGLFYGFLKKRDARIAFWSLPFIWVAIEFLRSFGALGFPWLAIGHSQAANLPYIQTADIAGVYGVSLLLVFSNLLLYKLVRHYERKLFIALILVITLPFVYGAVLLGIDMRDPDSLHFRIVQPNVGAKEKWMPENRIPIIEMMDSLSRSPAENPIDVIVWPETAVPYYLRSSRYFTHVLQNTAKDMNSTLISGALDYFFPNSGAYASTNSLFVIEPDSGPFTKNIYDKIHLVPFGEFTPGGRMFAWLNNMQYGQSDFRSRKNMQVPVLKDSIPFTPMICYDSVFPHTARKFTAQGSKYNILITNDIWFGRSLGPHQHAALASVRAVECRRPLVRAANAGVSMFIDEKGRVLKKMSLYRRGTLEQKLQGVSYRSLYLLTGNALPFLFCLLAFPLPLILLWIQKRKK